MHQFLLGTTTSPTLPESLYTPPRPDCPYPSRWHATDDQSTEVEVSSLVAAMITALQPDFVVETGTCIGNTSVAIGQALQRNGQGHLVSLEVDEGRVTRTRARCHGLPVTVLQQSSLDWLPTQRIDFAFFDSLAKLRAAEFERYYPWMHERTVVAFHDTGPHHPVRAFLKPLEDIGRLVSPLYLPTPRGIMFARVGHSQPQFFEGTSRLK